MVLRAGARAVRVAPWPADEHTAQLTALPGEPAPTSTVLRAALQEAAAVGYVSAITGALGASERPPFAAAGFEPMAWLHLLERPLHELPALPTSPATLRRIRRADWPAVAAVDTRAFPAFWHLGADGIADARRATPSNRLRIAVGADDDVVGYAVFGRSGGRGFVQRIAVDPTVHGRGIGTTLLVDGLQWLRARGAVSALVNTQIDNERALKLYLRLGFRLLQERLAVLGRPTVKQ